MVCVLRLSIECGSSQVIWRAFEGVEDNVNKLDACIHQHHHLGLEVLLLWHTINVLPRDDARLLLLSMMLSMPTIVCLFVFTLAYFLRYPLRAKYLYKNHREEISA